MTQTDNLIIERAEVAKKIKSLGMRLDFEFYDDLTYSPTPLCSQYVSFFIEGIDQTYNSKGHKITVRIADHFAGKPGQDRPFLDTFNMTLDEVFNALEKIAEKQVELAQFLESDESGGCFDDEAFERIAG